MKNKANTFENSEKIKEFLQKTFHCSMSKGSPGDIEGVIDLLERLADLLRFENNYYTTKLSIEEFVGGEIEIDKECLTFKSKAYGIRHSGKPAITLQPLLIKYLLLHHKQNYRIFDIIRDFTAQIRPKLTIIDFKKTETGAIRCYTNTRFASNTLRDYGLLKYTQDEAYKTWNLSLAGFVVAAKLITEEGMLTESNQDKPGFPVHSYIRNAWDDIKDYQKFVFLLSSICKPEVKIFSTYQDVLEKAYDLLKQYWEIMNSEHMTSKERQNYSLQCISKIEELKGIEEFYMQLSTHMNIEQILKGAGMK